MATANAIVKSPLPLDFMQKLSEQVYVLRQDDQTSKRVDRHPAVILLLGWMAARDAHLAKYAHEHQRRYPDATIILVRARFAMMASKCVAWADVRPVVQLIASAVDAGDISQTRPMLIHLFSNGGSCLLSSLYDAWSKKSSLKTDSALPTHITIFDSAPSLQYESDKTVLATMIGLPKGIISALARPIVRLLSLIWWIRFYVLGVPDRMVEIATSHNDKSNSHELRRVYLYSDADILIRRADVEYHAEQARRKGFNVTQEFFQGSPHVAHARTDPVRYWKIIDDAWMGT